jgi:hypothetical protein
LIQAFGRVRGKGRFLITEYAPPEEGATPKLPLLPTTGRVLIQHNVAHGPPPRIGVHCNSLDKGGHFAADLCAGFKSLRG